MGGMKRALVVLAVLLLAGCGGGDEPGTGGGPDLRAAYVADASKVCQTAKAESDGLTTPTTAAAFPPFVAKSVALVTRAQRELSALTPPPADAEQLRSKVLDPFAALAEKATAYGAQVKAAGTDQAKLLPLLSQAPTAEGIDLPYLREYGLGVCADVLESRS